MFPRILAPVLFLATFGACYSWQATPYPDAGAVPGDSTVRLTLINGIRLHLALPTIAADSLRAWDITSEASRRAFRNETPVPVIVPVLAIREIESAIRVTFVDGNTLELSLPRVTHDTLRAWDRRELLHGRAIPVRVPVSQVREIKVRRPSPEKTLALVVAVPVGTAAIFLYMIGKAMQGSCFPVGCSN